MSGYQRQGYLENVAASDEMKPDFEKKTENTANKDGKKIDIKKTNVRAIEVIGKQGKNLQKI